MTETDDRIDRAARAFNEAASELVVEMLKKLEQDAPTGAKMANSALAAGERMQLVLEFSVDRPLLIWQLVDDYEKPKRLMTIRPPSRQ